MMETILIRVLLSLPAPSRVRQGVERDYHSFIIRSVSRLEPHFYFYALSFNDYLLQL